MSGISVSYASNDSYSYYYVAFYDCNWGSTRVSFRLNDRGGEGECAVATHRSSPGRRKVFWNAVRRSAHPYNGVLQYKAPDAVGTHEQGQLPYLEQPLRTQDAVVACRLTAFLQLIQELPFKQPK